MIAFIAIGAHRKSGNKFVLAASAEIDLFLRWFYRSSVRGQIFLETGITFVAVSLRRRQELSCSYFIYIFPAAETGNLYL